MEEQQARVVHSRRPESDFSHTAQRNSQRVVLYFVDAKTDLTQLARCRASQAGALGGVVDVHDDTVRSRQHLGGGNQCRFTRLRLDVVAAGSAVVISDRVASD